jgi:hypothetical protein
VNIRGAGTATRRAWPSIGLGVTAESAAILHFELEYGPSAEDQSACPLEITIGPIPSSFPSVASWQGRRRTTTWRVALASPDRAPLRAAIDVRGVFGLPLLQSLAVEPLLSVAFARRGEVLLPAAGILRPAGLLIALGGPRAGKSSLAVRGLGRGLRILGDDHVILEPQGSARAFPRRLRLYPDLIETAPDVYRRLPAARRRDLRLRELGRRLSRGRVRLPILVPAAEIGGVTAGVAGGATAPAEEVAILQRSPDVRDAVIETLEAAEVAARAGGLIEADRSILQARGSAWAEACGAALRTEIALLESAWATTPARAVTVPARWPAIRAFEQLERVLGLA